MKRQMDDSDLTKRYKSELSDSPACSALRVASGFFNLDDIEAIARVSKEWRKIARVLPVDQLLASEREQLLAREREIYLTQGRRLWYIEPTKHLYLLLIRAYRFYGLELLDSGRYKAFLLSICTKEEIYWSWLDHFLPDSEPLEGERGLPVSCVAAMLIKPTPKALDQDHIESFFRELVQCQLPYKDKLVALASVVSHTALDQTAVLVRLALEGALPDFLQLVRDLPATRAESPLWPSYSKFVFGGPRLPPIKSLDRIAGVLPDIYKWLRQDQHVLRELFGPPCHPELIEYAARMDDNSASWVSHYRGGLAPSALARLFKIEDFGDQHLQATNLAMASAPYPWLDWFFSNVKSPTRQMLASWATAVPSAERHLLVKYGFLIAVLREFVPLQGGRELSDIAEIVSLLETAKEYFPEQFENLIQNHWKQIFGPYDDRRLIGRVFGSLDYNVPTHLLTRAAPARMPYPQKDPYLLAYWVCKLKNV